MFYVFKKSPVYNKGMIIEIPRRMISKHTTLEHAQEQIKLKVLEDRGFTQEFEYIILKDIEEETK